MDEMRLALVRQVFPRPRAQDPVGLVEAEALRLLENWRQKRGLPPTGWRLGIPVGSRGINRLPELVAALVRAAVRAGAKPFLVPAMGSHGGGTPEGQVRLLWHLGVTEASTGAPILAGSDVVSLGEAPGAGTVYADGRLAQADAVLLLNRVKPHTSFHGPVESGLLKMLAVGIGKAPSAAAFHSLPPEALSPAILERSRVALRALPVAGGIAVVENGYDEAALVQGLLPEEMESVETSLLEQARQWLPRLPVEDLDLLIVDSIGKNFSGTGMDTNVVGRLRIDGQPEPSSPRIRRILARGLSPETDGNAYGIGLADFTTRRAREQARPEATYANALATGFLRRAMWPLILDDDRQALAAAAESLKRPPSGLTALRIANTLSLERLWVSDTVLAGLLASGRAEMLAEPAPLRFGPDGSLLAGEPSD